MNDDTMNDENTMSTSIRSLMSAIAEDQIEDRLHSVPDDEMDDYLNSASSESDYTDDEAQEDSNNNNNENMSSKDIVLVGTNEKIAVDSLKDNVGKTENCNEGIANKDTSSSK